MHVSRINCDKLTTKYKTIMIEINYTLFEWIFSLIIFPFFDFENEKIFQNILKARNTDFSNRCQGLSSQLRLFVFTNIHQVIILRDIMSFFINH